MITGDYHTHTTFSHGKGSIADNCGVAREKGLKQIAITDHAFKQAISGMRKKDVEVMRSQIDAENAKGDLAVLLGIEANVLSGRGEIDFSPHDNGLFDLVALGYHDSVLPVGFTDFFSFNMPLVAQSRLGYKKNGNADKFTKALINAVMRNKINFISHINSKIQIDVDEIGKACVDYNVFVELNPRHLSLSDEQILRLLQLGCNFIVNSDAHVPTDVGNFSSILKCIERLGIDKGRIVNWEKIPKFERI